MSRFYKSPASTLAFVLTLCGVQLLCGQTATDTSIKLKKSPAKKSAYAGKLIAAPARTIDKVLDNGAKFDYFEQRFGDIIQELKTDLMIPIVLHDSVYGNNLDEDTLITLTISGISTNSALKIMLAPYDCTFSINDEVLYVVSHQQSVKMQETRIYDCSKLYEKIQQPDKKKLAEIVTLIVEPASWTENGGNGRVTEIGGRLIVCQTNQVHDKIANLLQALDEEFSKN